jgi:hypothetical protein
MTHMNLAPLLKAPHPWLHVLAASESDAYDAVWGLERLPASNAVCRFLRGRKATRQASLFDEMAAALQFPYYFGENWDAVDECLADLEWLPADAYVLCFSEAGRLMADEAPAQRLQLFNVLQTAAREWSGRTGKIFHVLFQCSADGQAALSKHLPLAQFPHDVLS